MGIHYTTNTKSRSDAGFFIIFAALWKKTADITKYMRRTSR